MIDEILNKYLKVNHRNLYKPSIEDFIKECKKYKEIKVFEVSIDDKEKFEYIANKLNVKVKFSDLIF